MSIKEVRVIPDEAGLYMPDDIPQFVEKYKAKTARKPRARRSDLSKGMVVVVLEGVFASRRVVYLKALEDNLALCAGPKSVSGVPFFKIDERYLLATSTILSIGVDVNVDEKNIILSERDVYDVPMDVEMTDAEKKIDEEIAKAVKEIKYMRTYLSEPFEIDTTRNFYSLKY
ncbi:ribosomal protein L6e domain-containing protein [Encephalitozoon intestinalis ATCC 50506]|uniref:60S ribosomal protein L6 n=1 Tax=Encephalitozoon intestinalis (strain ATCC 50506) TaxID=876142 RepID=E0S8R8_ENCIT|nr:ribosomal protein L6e domain-containing protein [Encephalitozoon intestinalis ATCC 50506]ADM12106.2 60S ribosomal protein L6 [Encephalitozoon intestinalis ATCC 50506]UTX45898.1 ribosomal protein L6 [Encephalitozoon intestinalis]